MPAATSAATDSRALDALLASVCDAASAFEAGQLSLDDTVVAMRHWSAIVNAADAALSMCAARIDELGPPPSAGARDAATFVAKQAGITTHRANDKIKTGNGFRRAARTRATATKGELSPEQAAAITDAVKVNPDAEGALLAASATHSLGGLREECAKAKAAREDRTKTEQRIHACRSLRRYRDADGAEHLHAVGTKLQMSRIDQALKPLIDRRFKHARADGVRERLEAYTFDALVDMADRSLNPAADERPAHKDPIRHLSVLRLDLSALQRGHVQDGETCEIAGLGPISVVAAREALGESVLKLVITKGVDVVNVTHLGRGPNTAQKIALLWQQPICSREGCGNRARLEYDHRDEWVNVRCTELANSDPLCHPDHLLKTMSGWALVDGTGTRPMVPPDDPRHPRHRNRPPP